MTQRKEVQESALDWLDRIDQVGPFAPIMQLQLLYDQAPEGIFTISEYWYVSGLIQGRRGYQPLPDTNISPEGHLAVLDLIADNVDEYGVEMAQQTAGLRDGYAIALGHFGDPRE